MKPVYDQRRPAILFMAVSGRKSKISNNFGMQIIGETQDLVKPKQSKWISGNIQRALGYLRWSYLQQ